VFKERVLCKNEHHDTKSKPSYCVVTHTLFGNKVGIVEEYLIDLKKEKKFNLQVQAKYNVLTSIN
jgi:hypothetical protein